MKCAQSESIVQRDAGLMGTSIPYWYCLTCKIELDRFGDEVKPEPEVFESATEKLPNAQEVVPISRRAMDPSFSRTYYPNDDYAQKPSDLEDLHLDFDMFEDDGGLTD